MRAAFATWAATAVAAALAFAPATARAQADDDGGGATWRLGSHPHTGVPFDLELQVSGLGEQPTPELPKLEIANATVTPLNAQPNVMRSVQIINGRRSESNRVTWVLRWRVVPAKEGTLHIPSVTVVQGSQHVTAGGGDAQVSTVPTADDMKIDLELPDRPVFIGENTPVKLVWLFQRQPADSPQFSLPLLDSDAVTASAPPVTDRRNAIELSAAGQPLEAPYVVDEVEVGGRKLHRLTVPLYIAPRTAGKLEVAAPSVTAAFGVGAADFFGNQQTQLFRAVGTPHTFEVKPLPEAGRPPGFAGAVGTQFSIAAATSRSVVQLGEPVEITVTVKSDERLDTLSLGRLDGDGGLPRDQFTVPADPPTGELSADGKTKTFKFTAQVIAPTRELPAIALAYFDPAKASYQTVKSDPIALAVANGNVVGANDVVGGAKPAAGAGAAGSGAPASAGGDISLVGADLALSEPGADGSTPLGGALLWIVVGVLYAVPLALFVGWTWKHRTAAGREEAAEVRAARRKLEAELARAQTAPAGEMAGAIGAAVRGLARALERDGDVGRGSPAVDRAAGGHRGVFDDRGLLAKIETESYAPSASASPLSADLRIQVSQLMNRWLAEAKPRGKRGAGTRAGAAVIALVLVSLFASTRADAAPPPAAAPAVATDAVAEGRAAYQDAMQRTDASGRRAAFARAESALADAASATPNRPELLADWGNAALGAGDVATATLAYRRALAIDPGNLRARRNLDWLHTRAGDAFRPVASGAADTLFFFHRWSRGARWAVGAIAFAIAILLVVPWTGRRRGALVSVAVVPAAVWIAMTISLLAEDRHGADAIVMHSTVLRAADSAGAPAALAQALPEGAEVTELERRDAWTKVAIPAGTAGWVPDGTVERIAR